MKWKHFFKNFQYHTYLGFLDLIYEYPCSGLLGSRMGMPSSHSWNKWIFWIFSSNHDEILLVFLYTFSYTKNDFVIHNSNVPVYQSHHRRNVMIHPQEKCSVHFCTKSEENLLLPKVFESKKIHVGIKSHQLYFSFWKKINQLIWMSRKSMNTIRYHFDR